MIPIKIRLCTKEVAKLLGKAPRTTRRYAQQGQFRAVNLKGNRGWQFDANVTLVVNH